MKAIDTGTVDPECMLQYYRGMLAEMREVCEERHERLSAGGDAFHVQAVMAAQLVPFLKRSVPGEAEKKAKTLIMLLHAQEHLQRQFIHLLNNKPFTVNDAEGCANYSIFALVTAALNRCGNDMEITATTNEMIRRGEAEEEAAGGDGGGDSRSALLADLDPEVAERLARRAKGRGSGPRGRNENEGKMENGE